MASCLIWQLLNTYHRVRKFDMDQPQKLTKHPAWQQYSISISSILYMIKRLIRLISKYKVEIEGIAEKWIAIRQQHRRGAGTFKQW